jgi:GNAT superfamily N-acetyltransferase
MQLIRRRYRCEDDYWRVRAFLRGVFLLHDRREVCWPLHRWDYWRWHVNENIFRFSLEAAVFLWEKPDGELAAVLHPDGPGEAFLQIHPAFRSTELEVEMMAAAETQFATIQPDGCQRLTLWTHESDALRQDLLTRRGYTRGQYPEYQRRRSLAQPLSESPVPQGYTVRSLGDEDELPARSWVSWRAFHPDEPDGRYKGWEWYRNVQRAPLYRRDLDLVAVAADGELAAFCTVWFDDVTRTAAFEPVGTHPAHQRRGLGRAVMNEGLRRAAHLGATLAAVGSYSTAAGALYASVGFTEYDLSEPWVKAW